MAGRAESLSIVICSSQYGMVFRRTAGRNRRGAGPATAFDWATPVGGLPNSRRIRGRVRGAAVEPAVVSGHGDTTTIRLSISGSFNPPLPASWRRRPVTGAGHLFTCSHVNAGGGCGARIEYPLLLTATGVSGLRPHHWRPAVAQPGGRESGRDSAMPALERSASPRRSNAGAMVRMGRRSHHRTRSLTRSEGFQLVLATVAVLLALTTVGLADAKNY